MTVLTKRQRRLRRRRRVRARITGTAERPRLSVYRSNRGVFAQLIDDGKGHTLAAVNWIEPELRKLTADRAGQAGRRAAGRARQGGRGRDLRLRPRRLPVPRPRQGARRGRPRGGAESSRCPLRWTARYEGNGHDKRRDGQPARARPAGAGDRDQPRRQGGQGRPALLLHRAGRRRRRRGRGRDRLRQGPRGAAGDPEGRRGRPQEPDPRAQIRADDHPQDHRPLRRRPRRPAPGQPRYRRDRRRRRPRRARARRRPRRAHQEHRHAEPDQPGQGDDGRADPPAPARGGCRAARADRHAGAWAST